MCMATHGTSVSRITASLEHGSQIRNPSRSDCKYAMKGGVILPEIGGRLHMSCDGEILEDEGNGWDSADDLGITFGQRQDKPVCPWALDPMHVKLSHILDSIDAPEWSMPTPCRGTRRKAESQDDDSGLPATDAGSTDNGLPVDVRSDQSGVIRRRLRGKQGSLEDCTIASLLDAAVMTDQDVQDRHILTATTAVLCGVCMQVGGMAQYTR